MKIIQAGWLIDGSGSPVQIAIAAGCDSILKRLKGYM
jgi:hypothetical protein